MRRSGFTLVEMVMTIVVMGIIFLGITSFVEMGTSGYMDTVDRQRIQNQARFVIEKLSREIRHGVPNSFDIPSTSGDKCLSFYPIELAGFYYRDELNGKVEFAVDNQGAQLSDTSGNLVINPSQQTDLTDGSHSVSLASSGEQEEEPAGSGVYTYSVDDNFPSHSVANRYYTYSDKVTYCVTTSGLVTRNGITVADGVVASSSGFEYKEATLQRGGLVHMDLLFDNDGEQSFYKHDVQVLNVP